MIITGTLISPVSVLDKQYLDSIGKQIGIRELHEWYSIDPVKLLHNMKKRTGLSILLGYYSKSLIKTLEAVYPEFPWQSWLFKHIRLPKGFWSSKENVTAFMNWVAKQAGVEEMEDWYKIPVAHLASLGGREIDRRYLALTLPCTLGKPLLNKGGGMYELLSTAYPHYNWDINVFENNKGRGGLGKSQLVLHRVNNQH